MDSDGHSWATVAVELEIQIRKIIWHLCVMETNLGAASDEDRQETHYQQDGAAAWEASADVMFASSSLDASLISNKKEPDKSGQIFCSKIKFKEKNWECDNFACTYNLP